MALFSIHFCGNKSFSTHKNSFLSFRSLSFCATCSFYFFSQFLSHFSPSENSSYSSIGQRNSKKGGHFKLLTPAHTPAPSFRVLFHNHKDLWGGVLDFLDNFSSPKFGLPGTLVRQKKGHVFVTSRCSSWRRPE